MRVNPISIANYRPLNYNQNHRITMPKQNVTFKSWQGSAGAAIGTLAGIGLGVLTGGLGTILIAAMTGCGLGGVIGESKGNACNDDETSYDLPNKYD